MPERVVREKMNSIKIRYEFAFAMSERNLGKLMDIFQREFPSTIGASPRRYSIEFILGADEFNEEDAEFITEKMMNKTGNNVMFVGVR